MVGLEGVARLLAKLLEAEAAHAALAHCVWAPSAVGEPAVSMGMVRSSVMMRFQRT